MRVFIVAALMVCSLCWWELGHMTISQIAYAHLTDTNQIATRDRFLALINAFNPFTDGKSNSWAEAAVWADDIKSYGAKFFDQYHFVNIPIDQQYLFKGMTQAQMDVNSINTLGWCQKVLGSNKDGISFERAFMARFLLHLVGDIHQPLHNTNMFNGTYKTGDLGGNSIKIHTKTNYSTNLHAYLDSMAQYQSMNSTIPRPLDDAGKAFLMELVQSIRKEYPPQHFGQARINLINPHAWAVQAYEIAVKDVYPYWQTTAVVDQGYDAKMKAMTREQAALAGYRLANTILSIYK